MGTVPILSSLSMRRPALAYSSHSVFGCYPLCLQPEACKLIRSQTWPTWACPALISWAPGTLAKAGVGAAAVGSSVQNQQESWPQVLPDYSLTHILGCSAELGLHFGVRPGMSTGTLAGSLGQDGGRACYLGSLVAGAH